jgi:hypothetical protein
MAVITIPYDYNEQTDRSIVPICIDDEDGKGKRIDQRLIKEGVVPAADPLRRIADRILRDVYRASEIADYALHSLWRTHGVNFGDRPDLIIQKRASHRAEVLRLGGPRARRKKEVGLFDSTMENLQYQFNHAAAFQARDTIDRLVAELERRGMHDIREMVPMILMKCNAKEFEIRFGASRKTLMQQFYRRVRKVMKSAGLFW